MSRCLFLTRPKNSLNIKVSLEKSETSSRRCHLDVIPKSKSKFRRGMTQSSEDLEIVCVSTGGDKEKHSREGTEVSTTLQKRFSRKQARRKRSITNKQLQPEREAAREWLAEDAMLAEGLLDELESVRLSETEDECFGGPKRGEGNGVKSSKGIRSDEVIAIIRALIDDQKLSYGSINSIAFHLSNFFGVSKRFEMIGTIIFIMTMLTIRRKSVPYSKQLVKIFRLEHYGWYFNLILSAVLQLSWKISPLHSVMPIG